MHVLGRDTGWLVLGLELPPDLFVVVVRFLFLFLLCFLKKSLLFHLDFLRLGFTEPGLVS